MNKPSLLSCALFLCLALPCAAQTPPAAAPDTREVSGLRADIAMQRYAQMLKDGTPAQIAEFYLPDGQLFLPGTLPITGPKEVEAFLVPLVKQAKVTAVSVKLDIAEKGRDNVTLWGQYSETFKQGKKQPQTVTGRFAAAWKVDGEGGLKILRLMMQPAPTK